MFLYLFSPKSHSLPLSFPASRQYCTLSLLRFNTRNSLGLSIKLFRRLAALCIAERGLMELLGREKWAQDVMTISLYLPKFLLLACVFQTF